jgi:RimJ/RimL family protein N-acetyltransferase
MENPFQTPLENHLIQLQPLKEEDFEKLYQVASDPLIWEQHPNPDRYKREVFENYFKGAIASQGAYLIIDARTKEIIGSSRFYDYSTSSKEVKIGYTFFSRKVWGQYHNKATKLLMLDHALQFADRVIFHVGSQNMRSRKAMEKLGAVTIREVEVAYFGEATKTNIEYYIDQLIRDQIH